MHSPINQLRQNLLHKRNEFSKNPFFSKAYMDLLLNIEIFLSNPNHAFKSIGFYWPYKNEPDLRQTLLKWQKSKENRILLLSSVRADNHLDFYSWCETTPMIKNQFGIPEPDPSSSSVLLLTPDCIFIPCVGWRKYLNHNWRLGYGGGYFDRTIQNLKEHGAVFKTVGVAYEWQEVTESEWSPLSHDQPLDYVLTNIGLHN